MAGVRYRDWRQAGVMVAVVQAFCFFLVSFLQGAPIALKAVIGLPVFLPGGILVMLFHLGNVHDTGQVDGLLMIALSWFFYTWILQWVARASSASLSA